MVPTVIDNFLPDADYKRLRDYVLAQPMTYGSKSNSSTDPHGHWSWKPVHDNNKNLADLRPILPLALYAPWKNYIEQRLGVEEEHAVIRCYANGYTYGTDGYFHTDSERADEQTIIIYICDKWERDWGGETTTDSGHWCYPEPNRAFIIPSNMLHAARAVSRKCNVLRTTLMYKVRKRRSPDFESLSQWLVANKALTLGHAKGTLHDHLVRVHALLEARGLPPATCFAGGLHSIYGTNVYQSQLVQPTPWWRAAVSDKFSKDAEALAFMFSVLERPGTLENPGGITAISITNPGPLGQPSTSTEFELRMRYDQKARIGSEMLRNLQLIEAANLADQGALDKWPNLQRLWDGP